MRSVLAGICLALMSTAALAQDATPATPQPTPPAPPAAAPTPTPGPQTTGPGSVAGSGEHADKPGGQDVYEGEIIATPDGTYMVTPMGRDSEGRGPHGGQGMNMRGNDMMGMHGMGMPGTDDDEDMPRSPGPPPGAGAPHPMPHGMAADFHIHTPNLQLGVKCAEGEPMRACVEAVSQLLDKIGSLAHH